MTRFLIVNADDYGRSPEVSSGIRQAHQEGIVTTTTILMNLPGAIDDLNLAHQETPELGIGLHLNLTLGKPLHREMQASKLVGGDGNFHPVQQWFLDPERAPIDLIEMEWRTQMDALASTGVKIDHLDSHHHIATFRADIWSLFLNLAHELGCGVRPPLPSDLPQEELQKSYPQPILDNAFEVALPALKASDISHPDFFLASFFDNTATLDHLQQLVRELKPGVTELMCHPGFNTPALEKTSSYNEQRPRELEILTNSRLNNLVDELGIKLVTYMQAWNID